MSASRLAALRAGGRQPRRARERSYVRANTLSSNERALERGLITLREYLVATSRLLQVDDGIGIVIDDVPDAAEEIVLGADGGALEEPEVVPEIPQVPQEHQAIPAAPLPVQEPPVVVAERPQPPQPLPVQEPAVVVAERPQPQPYAIQCQVCLENPPTLVLRPCGHVMCSHCRERIGQTCPFCRQVIVETIRFFF